MVISTTCFGLSGSGGGAEDPAPPPIPPNPPRPPPCRNYWAMLYHPAGRLFISPGGIFGIEGIPPGGAPAGIDGAGGGGA